MAVHEKYPATTGQVFLDHLLGLRTLASSKRDLLALLGHVGVLSEAFEACDRVRTLGKDEDERSSDRAVFV